MLRASLLSRISNGVCSLSVYSILADPVVWVFVRDSTRDRIVVIVFRKGFRIFRIIFFAPQAQLPAQRLVWVRSIAVGWEE